MNTKFTFALLVIVIALVATACAPAIVDNSAPIDPAAAPVDNEKSAPLPVTGNSVSTSARDTQEPRLWSGEISLSDNSNPDHLQNAQPAASEVSQNDCMSEDSLPERQSGCVE